MSDNKRVEISFPAEFYERLERVAGELGMTVPMWCRMAVASYYGKWKSPVATRKAKSGKDPDAEGMWCDRCAAPAASCQLPELHKEWGEWSEWLEG